MSRIATFAVLVLATLGTTASVEASTWMFQPSYFSQGVPARTKAHIPSLNGRAAYRRPFVNLAPSGSVRGGYRFNRVQIQSGNSIDTTFIRENFYQFQPAP